MTQQDIVNELNRMVIGYNINWDMIKYDADRAIMKINAHLGAEFPRMSEIMLHPNSRYAIYFKNMDRPIFPERYILTVVIPFIATEVLARDEEFTTIYNKYAMDFENGLFEMFQNEFNKVLPIFRQDPDVGVFFSKELDKGKAFHKHIDDKLLKIYFNVYYHFNEEWEDLEQFTLDLNKYEYKSSIICKAPTITNFIKGIYAYRFDGWSTSPNISTIIYNEGDTIENITSDVHLYAVWDKVCIINITDDGEISIDDAYKDYVVDLNIPQYIDGKRVKVISTGFTEDATNLLYLTLPRTNLTINTEAIVSDSLRKLTLPLYDYLRDYPNITISASAIDCPNIEFLYIPYSVSTIGESGITGVQKIKCEIESKPASWHENWTDAEVKDEDWGVPNG